MRVYIIGVGPGTEDYVLPVARRRIEECDCLIGARRLLALFSWLGKEEICIEGHFDKAISYIKKYKQKKNIVVLVSGDPGIYSLLAKLSGTLSPQEYSVIPGISTLQLAFARIGETWYDAKIISLHGRKIDNLADELSACEKAFLLTDSHFPAHRIAGRLLKQGLENRRVVVLKNLSYPDEKIIDTDLRHLSKVRLQGLCAMIIKRQKFKAERGKLYGIGIGPGDPKLITLKAKEILDMVDTVFVPKSSGDGSSLARCIVEAVSAAQKTFHELTFPMTEDRLLLERYWKKAANTIAKEINKGRDVAFITIGDPFIYSTYIYLLKTMRRYHPQIKIETIPGISAFNAAASSADLALIEGKQRMAIVPVTKNWNKVREALLGFDTVVLMKVGSKLDKVILLLKELGLVKQAMLISRTGHRDERIIRNLSRLQDKKTGYLSVIIVKKGDR